MNSINSINQLKRNLVISEMVLKQYTEYKGSFDLQEEEDMFLEWIKLDCEEQLIDSENEELDNKYNDFIDIIGGDCLNMIMDYKNDMDSFEEHKKNMKNVFGVIKHKENKPRYELYRYGEERNEDGPFFNLENMLYSYDRNNGIIRSIINEGMGGMGGITTRNIRRYFG